jgi:pseudouridine-5'-phosphate glycosidase
MPLLSRAGPKAVALETTLLLHGVPKDQSAPLARELCEIIKSRGVEPALIGVVGGQPIVGLNDVELQTLLDAPKVPKANTANLGLLLHQGSHAATTVSTTMELAAAAGIRLFATGGIGGVHRGYADHLDISADLAALTRFPVAVVASGVKSILDVTATRELLEALGVPVVGFRTTAFPAFYLRQTDPPIALDATFDEVEPLAAFAAAELARTKRGILICNPIPAASELRRQDWDHWLAAATDRARAQSLTGRDLTPFLLSQLHQLSAGATLRANLDLVRSNAHLAADLCRVMPPSTGG